MKLIDLDQLLKYPLRRESALCDEEHADPHFLKKIKGAIEDDTLKYIVFRRKDAWDRTESPAVAILDEECANARPLIRECVEKHIKEYPFHELDRDEIGEVIYDVIMDRILAPRKEAHQ